MQVYVQGIVFTCKIYGGLRARVHSSIQTAVACLLVAVFCAHISMLASQRPLPEHYTQRFQRGKRFPIASYPMFFFHHFDSIDASLNQLTKTQN